jgi:hypothetical protein
MSKIMGPRDLTGGQQFDPAEGETPDSEAAGFPDTPVTVTRPPDQGHAATVEVIPSNADRLHLNRSGRRD